MPKAIRVIPVDAAMHLVNEAITGRTIREK